MAAPTVPANKGKTAYFAFCEEQRGAVQEELQLQAAQQQSSSQQGDGDAAAAGPSKVSVAVVAKELGARWKALTDAQRQLYKNIAAANKAADQADKQRAAEDGGGEEAQDAAGAAQQGTGLPISVVKRIIMCDTEVGRVSKDATALIATAAEAFVAQLAQACAAATERARPKRRTVKLADFESVVRSDRRLVAAGMRDVVALMQGLAAEAAEQQQQQQQEAEEAEGGGEGAEGGGAEGAAGEAAPRRRGPKKARVAPASTGPKMKGIMTFFPRAPAAAPMEAEPGGREAS